MRRSCRGITIVTIGSVEIIEQIKSQLGRLVPVRRRDRPDGEGAIPSRRELALVKVAGKGEKRVESLRLAEVFRGRSWTRPRIISCSRSRAAFPKSTTSSRS